MEANHVWILTTFGGGFVFLLGWIMKLQGEMGNRPTFEWCEEHHPSKDVITVKLDKIEDDVKDIKESLKTLTDRNG